MRDNAKKQRFRWNLPRIRKLIELVNAHKDTTMKGYGDSDTWGHAESFEKVFVPAVVRVFKSRLNKWELLPTCHDIVIGLHKAKNTRKTDERHMEKHYGEDWRKNSRLPIHRIFPRWGREGHEWSGKPPTTSAEVSLLVFLVTESDINYNFREDVKDDECEFDARMWAYRQRLTHLSASYNNMTGRKWDLHQMLELVVWAYKNGPRYCNLSTQDREELIEKFAVEVARLEDLDQKITSAATHPPKLKKGFFN